MLSFPESVTRAGLSTFRCPLQKGRPVFEGDNQPVEQSTSV